MKEELDKQAAEFSERKRRGKSDMKEFAQMVELNDKKLLEKEVM